MAEKNWKQPITEEEFKASSVSALADRPNQPASYGVGGLSAKALKEWFDKTSVLLKNKLNDLIAAVSDKEFFRNLQVDFGDVINAALAVNGKKIENFYDLVEAIEDGTLARCALMVQDPVGGLISIESSIGKIYDQISLHGASLSVETNDADDNSISLCLKNKLGKVISEEYIDPPIKKIVSEMIKDAITTTLNTEV